MSSKWTPTPRGVRPTPSIAPPPPRKKGVKPSPTSVSGSSSSTKTNNGSSLTSKTKKAPSVKVTGIGTAVPPRGPPRGRPPPHGPPSPSRSHLDIHSAKVRTTTRAHGNAPSVTASGGISKKKQSATGASPDQPQALYDMSGTVRDELRKIKSAELSELKGFQNPPELLQAVMTAVLTLFGEKDTSWRACMVFLGTKNVLSMLLDFDLEDVTPLRLKKLSRLVEKDNFTVEHMRKVSRAGASLCAWVLAVYNYMKQQQEEKELTPDSAFDNNFDGIPREYDLLSSTTHRQKPTKKKKAPAIASHLKAIELLNSDELGKIPLKDQLKGLHRELSEEAFDNMVLDDYPSPPSSQQQRQSIEDMTIPLDEPFYFEPEDSRDLPTLPAKESSYAPLPPTLSSKTSALSRDGTMPPPPPPVQDPRYSQKLGGPPPLPPQSLSKGSKNAAPPLPPSPSTDTTYSQGHLVGAKGGQLITEQQQQVEAVRKQAREEALLEDMKPSPEEDENAALLVKFAELIIDTSRIEKSSMIGEGYFGQVWRGVWDGCLAVALKGLKHGVKSSADKNKFFSEVSSLAKMRHPNVTVFYGATPPPQAYIISELLQCSLFQLIYAHKQSQSQSPKPPSPIGAGGGTPKPLPLKVILRILSDVAYGGNYLHNMKPHPVIHRDLTSSNVLLTVPANLSDEALLAACADQSKPIAKLTDFGLSREVDWCMTACVGNLFYLAPEVYTGEHYSESADIYSFGILMWEIVSRESPHGGVNPQRVAFLAATQNLRPPLTSSAEAGNRPIGNHSLTSEPFRFLTRRCWHADPHQRPAFKDICLELQTLRKAQLPPPPQSAPSPIITSPPPGLVTDTLTNTYNAFSSASVIPQHSEPRHDPWQQTRARLDDFLLHRPSMEQLSRMGAGGAGLITPWYLREYQEDAARSLPLRPQANDGHWNDDDEEEEEDAGNLLLPPGDKNHPMHRVLADLPEEQRAGAIHELLLQRSTSGSSSGGGEKHRAMKKGKITKKKK